MKRWTLRIVLLLVLGCVTTVAVAWGAIRRIDPYYFAVYNSFGEITDTLSREGLLTAEERKWVRALGPERVDAAIQKLPWAPPDQLRAVIAGSHRDLGTVHFHDLELAIEFNATTSIGNADPQPGRWATGRRLARRVASGWPMHAMRSEERTHEWPTISYLHSFRPGSKPDHSVYVRAFPLRPIWPGFVINTLFYGVIWFGILFGFGSARRVLRRKRGRCPKCNYDLRGELDNGCSECGWNRREDD